MSQVHKNKFINKIISQAKKDKKHIILPECEDPRVVKAAQILAKKNIAKITLIGKTNIKDKNIQIIDPKNPPKDYSQKLYQLRKKKGLTIEQAKELLKEPIYYATMMVKSGDADGIVSGAAHPTSHTFRPALQIIKTKKGIKTASSYFIMLLEKQILFFADCGLNINPTKEQLADIALSTAQSASQYMSKPKVALLSCSTKGSATDPIIQKVFDATKIAQKKNKTKAIIDGELQVDAALIKTIGKKKAPNSKIQGDANTFIFPDLNSGNIAYKLVERLAGATALGPISQGIAKPVNDLSRGCSVEDIIDIVAITAVQAQNEK